jgi:radical SAM protein, TatD family-associated
MIVDSHCHLDFKDFDPDRDDVIDRAKRKGVVRIINVASSIDGSRRSVELAKKYDIVYASVGVHPHDASQVTDKVVEDLRALATGRSLGGSFSSPPRDDLSVERSKVVAIGEVGLDYYRNLSPKEKQIEAFKKFISLALDLDLPLIIHSREADADTIGILKQYKRPLKGVIHCFSGDEKFLKECIDLGFNISFTANLTFKKAQVLRDVARIVPIEKVLLETDAPYLAPEGMRGKRNEPAHLTYLIDEWVKLTGLSREDIERITTHNANELFKLGLKEESSKIAYEIRDSLYLNITNECTNNCYFCIRATDDYVKGHNLKLDKEPSVEEILRAIVDVKKYREIVFCGYGEPTARLDVVKAVCRELKKSGAAVRLVTNGHGDIINKRKIAQELAGLVDNISVSLNTDTEDLYNKACSPEFGSGTYEAVMKFIKDCVEAGIRAEVTCLNLPGVDLVKCASIAKGLGASFRARTYGVTG